MNTQLVQPQENRLARPLKVLLPLIREEIDAGDRDPHYAVAGQMLSEASFHFANNREFYAWATKNFDRTQDTLRKWIRYAEAEYGTQPVTYAPASFTQSKPHRRLSDVVDPRGTNHQPAWHAPVQETLNRVDVPRMRQQAQDKEREAKLQRQLGLQLIDIGYKALAAKLHPDKGGSRDAMTRLNQVRQLLKGALQ